MSSLISALGLGQFGNNSHPIHPSTVHLPVAFLLSASVLDILTYIGQTSPGALTPLMQLTTYTSTSPNHLDNIALISYLSLFSYTSTVAALLTALPTLATGLAEGYACIQANGLDLSKPKVRVLALHAAANDLALLGAAINFWTRRGEEGFLPGPRNTVISTAMLGLVVYSAYLGGSLVYKYGMGVQRQGAAKKIAQEEKEGIIKEGEKKERKKGGKEL